MFDKLQHFLQRYLGPFATKLNQSELVSALTNGVMGTMPITLVSIALSFVLYFPFFKVADTMALKEEQEMQAE